MHIVAVPGVRRGVPDDRGKDGHGRDGSGAERRDVGNRGRACGKRERGNHAEEMGAPGNPMQHPETERRVRMAYMAHPARPGLHVQVVVADRTVDVRRRFQMHAAAKRPDADQDERCADEPLAPSRDDIHRRQCIAKQHREQCDEYDTGRMPEAPGPPRNPAAAPAVDGQRRDGGQMVGSREDVKEAGLGTGNDGKHRDLRIDGFTN